MSTSTSGATQAVRALRRDELWTGEMRGVILGGVRVLLLDVGGTVHAFEDRCAHMKMPLSSGTLEGGVLTCATHGWRYDASSGRGLNPERVCLRRFRAITRDGDIWVEVPTDDGGARVGPVLTAGGATQAIIAAMRRLNPDLEVTDRGSYLRVHAAGCCRLTRAAVERELGGAFRLPGDLEQVMTSFRGRFAVSEEEASWSQETAR
jgi:toluene monooxygenase system ferredoxin subunit